MNRYFDNEQAFNSNSRIFNAYYTNQETTRKSSQTLLETVRAKLACARASKQLRKALRIARPIVFSAALLSLLGIAAAIEAGSLGLGAGIVSSAVLFGIEYLCLRAHRA